jgi:hypothetical protein
LDGALKQKIPSDGSTKAQSLVSTATGSRDPARGQPMIGAVVGVNNSQGYASHFERDAHHAHSLRIESFAVKEPGPASPPLRRGLRRGAT